MEETEDFVKLTTALKVKRGLLHAGERGDGDTSRDRFKTREYLTYRQFKKKMPPAPPLLLLQNQEEEIVMKERSTTQCPPLDLAKLTSISTISTYSQTQPSSLKENLMLSAGAVRGR